jgi:hypothetical protein
MQYDVIPDRVTKPGGFEIGPVFKRGAFKVNSRTLNKTIIKPKIILSLKLLLYIL